MGGYRFSEKACPRESVAKAGDMRQRKEAERIPIHSIGMRFSAICCGILSTMLRRTT